MKINDTFKLEHSTGRPTFRAPLVLEEMFLFISTVISKNILQKKKSCLKPNPTVQRRITTLQTLIESKHFEKGRLLDYVLKFIYKAFIQ